MAGKWILWLAQSMAHCPKSIVEKMVRLRGNPLPAQKQEQQPATN